MARFIKGAVATAHAWDLAEDELKSAQDVVIKKAARKKILSTAAQKDGGDHCEKISNPISSKAGNRAGKGGGGRK